MLSGFNTNVRYRGVLFHIQTEDSGRANPHVITHLFHGGDILASEKRTYADKLESNNTDGEVRSLMEGQHRAMLTRLKEGHYDSGVEKRLGPDVWSASKGEVTEPASPKRAGDGSPETPKEKLARVFGEGVVSKKPLDEVVLDYLVENARKRKRPRK